MKKSNLLTFLAMALMSFFLPDLACASGGLDQFSSPLDTIVNTVSGPVGKAVAIIGMVICGFLLVFKREEISGSISMLVSVVFAISFISFGSGIVGSLFTFNAALV